MANYDENNKGTIAREHFRKKLAGLTFPLTFNSKRKAMLSALYTIRAEEPNSIIVSASTATQEYRFLVKSINHESHTDPEAYPDSDAMGKSIPKEMFEMSASLDSIKLKTVVKYFTQKPSDVFSVTASIDAIKLRSVVKYYTQPHEDSFTLSASLDAIKLRSVVIYHTQPMEDKFKLTSEIEKIRSVKVINEYVDSTETYANSNTITVTVPSGAKVGDVLVSVIVTTAGTQVLSPEWTNEFTASPNNVVNIFTKVWDGSETTYTFSINKVSKWSAYCYMAEEYVKQDYTVQPTRNYSPSTGNELRIIGFDDGFEISKYTSKEHSLISPSGGLRTGFPKYLANESTNNIELAGTVSKIPITSLDPITIEVEFPNPNIDKQFMVIIETLKVGLLNAPSNVTVEFIDPRIEVI